MTGKSANMLDNKAEQEQYLPIANVSRIMKKSLPANAKISKDAKETVQECVSEFISFVTGEASDKCQREKRKTVNGDDLLWAMTTLGFENYVGPLKDYLGTYRETEGEKSTMARQEDSPFHESVEIRPDHLKSLNKSGGYFLSVGSNMMTSHDFDMNAKRIMGTDVHQGVDWYSGRT